MSDSLRATGGYRTPPGLRPRLPDRWLGRYDTWLAAQVISSILRGFVPASLGRYTQTTWREHSAEIMRAFEFCGARVVVDGMAPLLSGSGPVVYAANHMSMLETLLLPAIVLTYSDASFVVKETLLRYPFFGAILSSTHPISVTRDRPRDDLKRVMTEGCRHIEAGRSVLIFPQSTRQATFDPDRFNSLAVKLARRAGAPVAPIALKTDFLGMGKWLRDFGPVDRAKDVRFRFGEPIPVTGSGKATHEAVVAFIARSLRSWGAEVKAEGSSSDERDDIAGSAVEPAV